MKPDEAMQQKPDKGKTAVGVVTVLARPVMLAFTIPGTAGSRYVGSIQSVWALGLLLVAAGLGQSPGLGICLALAVVSQIEHRAKGSVALHSYFVGLSQLTRLGLGALAARYAEAVLVVVTGLFVLGVDEACGFYLMCAGASEVLLVSFLSAVERARDLDMEDVLAEQEARANRLGGRFGGS